MLLKLRKTKTIGKPRNIEKTREKKFLTSLIRLVPLELIDETLKKRKREYKKTKSRSNRTQQSNYYIMPPQKTNTNKDEKKNK